MRFLENTSQLKMFVFFLVLGIKMGLQQQFFFFLRDFFKKKFLKVFSVILNCIFIVLNCAQFYLLALVFNFGEIRLYMFVSFFLGMFLASLSKKLTKKIKSLKKSKIRQQNSQQI